MPDNNLRKNKAMIFAFCLWVIFAMAAYMIQFLDVVRHVVGRALNQ